MADELVESSSDKKVKVAVIGAGWWSQGWHLPHLAAHPDVDLVAICDTSLHPQSPLNPDMEGLEALAAKYQCQIFHSVQDLLEQGPEIDGALIATPHATHTDIGLLALQKSTERLKAAAASGGEGTTNKDDGSSYKPIHIMMEKPMSVCVDQAHELVEAVEHYRQQGGRGTLLINHTANYRPAAIRAREIVASGKIGTVRHVTASMASPLSWIFENPLNRAWNEPSGTMLGNGFGWAQASHLLAWIFHVCPELQPDTVFCSMTHSQTTGADVAHAATITCKDGAVLSVSGTSLLPGHAHSDPPVGKRLRMEIYGSVGALIYHGMDIDPNSGRLEVVDDQGQSETVIDKFEFEQFDQDGTGPESLQNWIKACQGKEPHYPGADCELGLKTVQTLAAMYQSHATKQCVAIQHDKKE